MNLSASWDYIEQVSRSRLSHNKTERHVSQFGEYIETIGAAGELAARRFLKLPETLHSNFDGGSDMIWGGIRVDVKATILTRKVHNRYLQWPVWKEIKSDIIILTAVSLEEKVAILLGWAYSREMSSSPVNEKREIPCHEIPVRSLHKPYELLEIKAEEITF